MIFLMTYALLSLIKIINDPNKTFHIYSDKHLQRAVKYHIRKMSINHFDSSAISMHMKHIAPKS